MKKKPADSTQIQKKIIDDSRNVVKDIHTRVMRSEALNGGFDRLLLKIENIEQTQNKLVEKVDLIHDAIYDPDQGLFARVKVAENAKSIDIEELEKELFEVKIWKKAQEKILESESKSSEEQEELSRSLKQEVNDLAKWKQKITSVGTWALLALSSGGLTLIGKLLYDFISGHIKYV